MILLYKVFKDSQITYDVNKPFFLTIVNRSDNEVPLENYTDDVAEENQEAENNTLNNHITQKILELKAREASRILIKARNESKKIIRNAQIASENIMKSREQEGYARGIERANAEYMEAIKELEEYKNNLKKEYERKIRAFEEQIVDLSLALARKIIDIEIDKNDEAILAALKNVMSKIDVGSDVVIEMSANNIRKINSLLPQHKFKLKENPKLGNTDILLNSENGIIDASLDVQFENLKKSLCKMSRIV